MNDIHWTDVCSTDNKLTLVHRTSSLCIKTELFSDILLYIHLCLDGFNGVQFLSQSLEECDNIYSRKTYVLESLQNWDCSQSPRTSFLVLGLVLPYISFGHNNIYGNQTRVRWKFFKKKCNFVSVDEGSGVKLMQSIPFPYSAITYLPCRLVAFLCFPVDCFVF